jgi:UDP-N-acetylmuramate--alanine ligase
MEVYMETKIIYFVHGTTTDNADKLCSGWKEAMLNDLGCEQAKNLGNTIKEKGINASYIEDFSEIAEYIKKTASDGDIIFTMGAGNVTDIGKMVC